MNNKLKLVYNSEFIIELASDYIKTRIKILTKFHGIIMVWVQYAL